MPYDIPSDKQGRLPTELQSKYKRLYEDRYPKGLDLSPGSAMHNYIVGEVMSRARRSKTVMSNRYPSWREIDHVMTSYVKLDAKEREVRGNDPRKPASLVIPISYAIREVVLTYETSAFLDEYPLFRYTNQGPEDTIGTALLEKVIEAQNRYMKVALGLYTQLSDGWTYGLGPAHIGWKTKYGRRRKMEDVEEYSLLHGGPRVVGRQETANEEVLFEGNAINSIDPYLYLPDVSVPGHLSQDGEYSGYLDPTSRKTLLSEEQHEDRMFNVRYIDPNGGRSALSTDQTGRGDRTGMFDVFSRGMAHQAGATDVIWMEIDLVSSEWKCEDGEKGTQVLGDNDYPEKWIFGVAQDGILIMASPMDTDHNMFNITCAVPTFDGRSVAPISGLEMISELQRTIDWYISSHVTNVRKALNDMFLVDPLLVNINDFINPGPGRLIRMRKSRWGQGTKDAIQQLQVTDVTQTHMKDAAVLIDIAQRILGVSENMQGGINPKRERISADETQGARQFGSSRQATKARLLSEQLMWDTGYIMAKQCQQYMSRETYVALIGRWEEQLKAEYGPSASVGSVDPMKILVDFDTVIGDRSMPGLNDVQATVKVFETMMNNPANAQTLGFDLKRLGMHTFREIGMKNVQEFMLKPSAQVMDDEQVVREAEKGNIVPTQEVNNVR